VLSAFFDIMSEIFITEHISNASHLKNKSTSSFSNILNQRSNETKSIADLKKKAINIDRDILNLIFGSTFMHVIEIMLKKEIHRTCRSKDYKNLITQNFHNNNDSNNNNNNNNNYFSENDHDHSNSIFMSDGLIDLIKNVFSNNRIYSNENKNASSNPIMHDSQVKLFETAQQHFSSIHNLNTCNYNRNDHYLQKENNSHYYSSKTEQRKMRGGRNIWKPENYFSAGDIVDCMDKEKCWFESMIVEIYADGSLKVHFMGWGSKWDDKILKTEISTRIAPLNTKTKNWRADLFEGGLVEIKCNDDLVNQKWMWGKITALSLKEAWVEVSYSFSGVYLKQNLFNWLIAFMILITYIIFVQYRRTASSQESVVIR
jgi:hypothetical protein